MVCRFLRRALIFTSVAAALIAAGGCGQPQRGFVFDVTADMRNFTPPEHPSSRYFVGTCEAIRALGPGDFMVVMGDMDPPGRVRGALDAVLGPDYVMYPVVGNHELDEPEHLPYLRAYNAAGDTLPGIVRCGPPGGRETCYAFDHGRVHFVILNEYYDGQSDASPDADVGDALYAWLAEDLAENRRPLVFVFGHEPVLSVPDMATGRVRHRGKSLDEHPEHNHRFWNLLRQHDVTAYFCGHTHNTSVSRINGVWQVDAGHARGLGDAEVPSTFVRVLIEPDGVLCRVYRDDAQGGPYELAYEERLR